MQKKPDSIPGMVVVETQEQLLEALEKQKIKHKVVKFEELGEPMSFNPRTGETKPIEKKS